ncbi:MAG: hypothetical protein AAFU85_09350 [Planctomycetota bacterium]
MKPGGWMSVRCWRACGLIAALVMTTQAGCGKLEFKGGGIRSVAAGTSSSLAVYAAGGDEKLVFALFTDVDSVGNTASAGSSWTGAITRTDGKSIDYSGDPENVVIDGTEYQYSDGRVFLVAAEGDTITVRQLDLPVGEGNYGEQFDRLADSDDVQDFLASREPTEPSEESSEPSKASSGEGSSVAAENSPTSAD